MIPRRHSTKLPTISSIRPITIRRGYPSRSYAQSGVFSRSRGTATKRGLKVVDPDTAITMIPDFFSKVPVTHYYSWTLPPGLPLRTLPGQLWADRSSIACSYALGYLEPQIREILMDMKGGWRYELRYHRTLVA